MGEGSRGPRTTSCLGVFPVSWIVFLGSVLYFHTVNGILTQRSVYREGGAVSTNSTDPVGPYNIFGGLNSLTLSSDGKFLYATASAQLRGHNCEIDSCRRSCTAHSELVAAGRSDNAVSAFLVNTTSSELSFIHAKKDFFEGTGSLLGLQLSLMDPSLVGYMHSNVSKRDVRGDLPCLGGVTAVRTIGRYLAFASTMPSQGLTDEIKSNTVEILGESFLNLKKNRGNCVTIMGRDDITGEFEYVPPVLPDLSPNPDFHSDLIQTIPMGSQLEVFGVMGAYTNTYYKTDNPEILSKGKGGSSIVILTPISHKDGNIKVAQSCFLDGIAVNAGQSSSEYQFYDLDHGDGVIVEDSKFMYIGASFQQKRAIQIFKRQTQDNNDPDEWARTQQDFVDIVLEPKTDMVGLSETLSTYTALASTDKYLYAAFIEFNDFIPDIFGGLTVYTRDTESGRLTYKTEVRGATQGLGGSSGLPYMNQNISSAECAVMDNMPNIFSWNSICLSWSILHYPIKVLPHPDDRRVYVIGGNVKGELSSLWEDLHDYAFLEQRPDSSVIGEFWWEANATDTHHHLHRSAETATSCCKSWTHPVNHLRSNMIPPQEPEVTTWHRVNDNPSIKHTTDAIMDPSGRFIYVAAKSPDSGGKGAITAFEMHRMQLRYAETPSPGETTITVQLYDTGLDSPVQELQHRQFRVGIAGRKGRGCSWVGSVTLLTLRCDVPSSVGTSHNVLLQSFDITTRTFMTVAEMEGAFSYPVPVVRSVTPPAVQPGDTLTVHGQSFGTSPLRKIYAFEFDSEDERKYMHFESATVPVFGTRAVGPLFWHAGSSGSQEDKGALISRDPRTMRGENGANGVKIFSGLLNETEMTVSCRYKRLPCPGPWNHDGAGCSNSYDDRKSKIWFALHQSNEMRMGLEVIIREGNMVVQWNMGYDSHGNLDYLILLDTTDVGMPNHDDNDWHTIELSSCGGSSVNVIHDGVPYGSYIPPDGYFERGGNPGSSNFFTFFHFDDLDNPLDPHATSMVLLYDSVLVSRCNDYHQASVTLLDEYHCQDVVWVSDGMLTCTVPPLPIGTGLDVTVTTPVRSAPAGTNCTSSAGAATLESRCPPGKHYNMTVMVCEDCPPGTHNGIKNGPCLPCPATLHCPSAGLSVGIPCPLGRTASVEGLSSCTLCPAGSFRDASSTACITCPLGHACPSAGSDHAEPCSEGWYRGSEGGVSCQRCAPGTFQDGKASWNCTLCPKNTYTDAFALKACLPCPFNSVSQSQSVSRDQCYCPQITHFGDIPRNVTCKPCPSDTNCPAGSIHPLPSTGHWLSVEDPERVYACSPSDSCPGGSTYCEEGYTGLSCTRCASDFYRTTTGNCRRCPGTVMQTLRTLGLVLVLVAVTAGVCLARTVSALRLGRLTTAAVWVFEWVRETQVVLSVFAGFCQSVFVIGSVEVDWPGSLEIIFEATTVLSDFDITLYTVNLQCLSGVSFFSRWLTILFAPIVMGIAVCAIDLGIYVSLRLPSVRGGRMDDGGKPGWTYGPPCITMFLFLVTSTFGVWNLTLFRVWQCRPFDSSTYVLAADPEIECYVANGEWELLASWSYFFFAVYDILFPALIVGLALRVRGSKVPRKDRWPRFLFVPYEDRFFWSELVIMGRKMWLSASLTLSARGYIMDQAMMVFLGLFLSCLFHILLRPWQDSRIDFLEFLMLSDLVMMLLLGILIDAGLSSQVELAGVFFVYFLSGAVVCMSLSIVAQRVLSPLFPRKRVYDLKARFNLGLQKKGPSDDGRDRTSIPLLENSMVCSFVADMDSESRHAVVAASSSSLVTFTPLLEIEEEVDLLDYDELCKALHDLARLGGPKQTSRSYLAGYHPPLFWSIVVLLQQHRCGDECVDADGNWEIVQRFLETVLSDKLADW